MAMTRKDYRAFAEMLKDVRKSVEDSGFHYEKHVIDDIEKEMIRIFKADNSQFKEGYFREASGSLNQMV